MGGLKLWQSARSRERTVLRNSRLQSVGLQAARCTRGCRIFRTRIRGSRCQDPFPSCLRHSSVRTGFGRGLGPRERAGSARSACVISAAAVAVAEVSRREGGPGARRAPRPFPTEKLADPCSGAPRRPPLHGRPLPGRPETPHSGPETTLRGPSPSFRQHVFAVGLGVNLSLRCLEQMCFWERLCYRSLDTSVRADLLGSLSSVMAKLKTSRDCAFWGEGARCASRGSRPAPTRLSLEQRQPRGPRRQWDSARVSLALRR